MTDYAISCGCGRTMTADGRAGRGAFRCGCGSRIRVSEQPPSARVCWYDNCRIAATTAKPLSLCPDHERDAVDHLAHLIVRFDWGPVVKAAMATERENAREPLKPAETAGWVYFMRRERLIKIGTTVDIRRRAQALNATVLARCPGSYAEEKQLHRRFREFRKHGEWFEPAPELMQLINDIRAESGLPSIPS